MAFIQKLFSRNLFKISITLAIYFCFLVYGICCNLFGPTWLDLKNLMNTSMEKMALSISLRSGSFSIGALLGGFLFNYFNRQVLYAIFLFIMGISTIFIPLIPDFNVFLALNSIFGMVSGASDTAVNAWMLDMWQEKSGPFMQALQFCWAVGFILAPLISHPFLSQESANSNEIIDAHGFVQSPEKLVQLNETEDLLTTINPINSTTGSWIATENIISISTGHKSRIHVPFAISGVSVIIGSIMIMAFYISKKYHKRRNKLITLKLVQSEPEFQRVNTANVEEASLNEEERKIDNLDESVEDEEQANEPRIEADAFTGSSDEESGNNSSEPQSCFYVPLMVTFSCLMNCFFCASEMTTFQYLPTFVVELDLGLDKFVGSFILSALAITFTIGRFMGILIAIKLKPEYILILDWVIMAIGNVILLFSPYSKVFLWSGSMVLGFGFAAFFPAVFSFLRNRLRVTNIISALLLLSSLSGNALGFPVFIGKYIEKIPLILIYGNLFCLFIICLTFTAIFFIEKKLSKTFHHLK